MSRSRSSEIIYCFFPLDDRASRLSAMKPALYEIAYVIKRWPVAGGPVCAGAAKHAGDLLPEHSPTGAHQGDGLMTFARLQLPQHPGATWFMDRGGSGSRVLRRLQHGPGLLGRVRRWSTTSGVMSQTQDIAELPGAIGVSEPGDRDTIANRLGVVHGFARLMIQGSRHVTFSG